MTRNFHAENSISSLRYGKRSFWENDQRNVRGKLSNYREPETKGSASSANPNSALSLLLLLLLHPALRYVGQLEGIWLNSTPIFFSYQSKQKIGVILHHHLEHYMQYETRKLQLLLLSSFMAKWLVKSAALWCLNSTPLSTAPLKTINFLSMYCSLKSIFIWFEHRVFGLRKSVIFVQVGLKCHLKFLSHEFPWS